MTWVKLDDRFWSHPKTRKAWREPRAVGLHVMALCRANEEANDGFVAPEWLEMQISDRKERERVTAVLVDVGLWEPFGDGHQIHDYLVYQPSADKVAEIQEARRLAGARGGQSKALRNAAANA